MNINDRLVCRLSHPLLFVPPPLWALTISGAPGAIRTQAGPIAWPRLCLPFGASERGFPHSCLLTEAGTVRGYRVARCVSQNSPALGHSPSKLFRNPTSPPSLSCICQDIEAVQNLSLLLQEFYVQNIFLDEPNPIYLILQIHFVLYICIYYIFSLYTKLPQRCMTAFEIFQ